MYLLKTPKLFTEEDIPYLLKNTLSLDAVQVIGGPMVPTGEHGERMVMQYFNNGFSLVFHAIERFSDVAKAYCDFLAPSSNCNFYLTPANGGTTQGMHQDPPSVLLHNAFGRKGYKILREGKESTFYTDTGYGIYVHAEEPHEAICLGLSGIVSFGMFGSGYIGVPDTRLEGRTLGKF